MRKLSFIIVFTLLAGLFQSCQSYSDGRMLKKFISRFNAEEYACAASYVYPGDRMNVAFFAKEVKKLAPHTFIKLEDYKTEKQDGQRFMKVKLKWENTTPALQKYFQLIGHPLDNEGSQDITLHIRDTNDGEKISFVWGIPNALSDNLWIASIKEKDGKPVASINLYKEPSSNSKIWGTMSQDMIVEQDGNSEWMQVYEVDNEGNLNTLFIHKSDSIDLDRTAYFSVGIFDSIGVILALIIIIAIIVPLYYLSSFTSSIFTQIPIVGPIICIALLLVILYVIYQLLEKILFELFIINLPY